MPAKFKCAVVGAGNMGKNHIRTYLSLPEVEFCGIVETDVERGKEVAEEFGIPHFASTEALLKNCAPNAVSVCVPTKHHAAAVKPFLENGIHVLVEKPIAMSVADGESMIALAKQHRVSLFVGHIERFNPAVRRVKEMIEKKELGEITAIMARRVGGFPPQIKDANIAVDLAIHDIDIVNFLLNELPREVTVNKQKNHIEQREDAVEFFLKYSHSSAYIQANWITPVKIRKLNITGTEGYLEMDYITQQIEYYKSNYEKFREEAGSFSDYILRFSEPDKITISVAKKEPLKEEIKYFLSQIELGKQINPEFSVEALRIVTCSEGSYRPIGNRLAYRGVAPPAPLKKTKQVPIKSILPT